jgi:hypothetical protein
LIEYNLLHKNLLNGVDVKKIKLLTAIAYFTICFITPYSFAGLNSKLQNHQYIGVNIGGKDALVMYQYPRLQDTDNYFGFGLEFTYGYRFNNTSMFVSYSPELRLQNKKTGPSATNQFITASSYMFGGKYAFFNWSDVNSFYIGSGIEYLNATNNKEVLLSDDFGIMGIFGYHKIANKVISLDIGYKLNVTRPVIKNERKTRDTGVDKVEIDTYTVETSFFFVAMNYAF